jgi:lysozyme
VTTSFIFPELERDEGFRSLPYRDTLGNWTNGIGNTHGVTASTPAVSLEEARATLAANVAQVERELDAQLPWWRGMNDVRQDVFVEMAFNMGIGHAPDRVLTAGSGLEAFRKMLADAETGLYGLAGAQMLLSKWARQVGDRAMRLSILMEHGVRA